MWSHIAQPPIDEQPAQPPPPAKQRKGFAIAGIILAVSVPAVGLIFSIIGLEKVKMLADAGKGSPIPGIVVPLPAGATAGISPPPVRATAGTSIAPGASSPAVDPGCIAAQSAGEQMTNTLNADKAAISRDQNNPSAKLTDLQNLVTDLQSLQRQMATAEAQATHQSVKAGISAMISDLNTFSSGLQAVASGDLSQVNQITTAGSNMKTDGQALKTTCAPGRSG